LCTSTTGSGRRPSPIILSAASLYHILDRYAQQCCPVLDVFTQSYHWVFMQVEYATDLVFPSQAVVKPLYEQLSRQAILTVKAEHVARGKRRAIVAADDTRQTQLAKRLVNHWPHRLGRVGNNAALDQKPAVGIGDRQWIAALPIMDQKDA
jgi:hypothetical protein